MKNIKNIIPYIVIFIVLVITNLFCFQINMDELWNYGFSYAIRIGEIPYNDFNMVITPFYPLLMSIPLFINNSLLTMIIVQSILITVSFYLLNKMYGKKSFLLLIIMIFFYPNITPSYNSFINILLIGLLFLELTKFKYKDILIGMLVAIAILTKQSIGIFFIIPTILIKLFKKEKIKYRILGFIIPFIPISIYLYKVKAIKNFIDQCFLGLFSFSGNAANLDILAVILFGLILFLSIKIIIKNKKDYSNYYILGAYSIFIPTFDYLHLVYVVFLFTLLIINNYEITGINIKKAVIISLVVFYGYHFIHIVTDFDKYPNDLDHFEFKYIEKSILKDKKEYLEYSKNNDVIFYDDDAYLFRIANSQKITYLDIVNHGNHGYKSSDVIIKELKKNKDKKILMKEDTGERIKKRKTQLDVNGYNYIIDNYKKVDKINKYDVYEYKE